MPENYKPYMLKELRNYLLHSITKKHFKEGNENDSQVSLKFAKFLFCCGEYQIALKELLDADYLVEATYLALSLSEMGLIKTKESLLNLLRSETIDKIEVQQ